MPKLTGQRIQDTLNFLLTTNLGTLAGRTAARALANAFLNASFPGGAGTPAYDAFSRELSLGGHLFDDPDQRRPTLARRILATGAMANAPGAPLAVYGRTLGTAPHPAGYNLGVGGGMATYMTVLGFPQGNTYRIFAQTTENDRIQGAPVQIF